MFRNWQRQGVVFWWLFPGVMFDDVGAIWQFHATSVIPRRIIPKIDSANGILTEVQIWSIRILPPQRWKILSRLCLPPQKWVALSKGLCSYPTHGRQGMIYLHHYVEIWCNSHGRFCKELALTARKICPAQHRSWCCGLVVEVYLTSMLLKGNHEPTFDWRHKVAWSLVVTMNFLLGSQMVCSVFFFFDWLPESLNEPAFIHVFSFLQNACCRVVWSFESRSDPYDRYVQKACLNL